MYQLFTKKKNVGSESVDSNVTAAVKSVVLMVQHNTFFNIMDHLAPLIRKKMQPVMMGEISFAVKSSCY